MNYPTYTRPTKRKDIPPDMVRLPTYNRTGQAFAVSVPPDPRRAYAGPRVVNQANASDGFARTPSVGDTTGDASGDMPAARLPTYNAPIVEGVIPRRPLPTGAALPTVNPAMLSRGRVVTGTPSEANPRPPLERATENLRTLMTTPVEDQNGRLASGGTLAAQAAGQAARSGSLAYTAGAGIGGLLAGIFRPKADEEIKRRGDIAQAERAFQVESALGRNQDEHSQRAAQTRVANANADYIERTKPVVALGDLARKGTQADAQARRAQQQSILSNLSQLKGQQLDPSNPAHAAFLERVQQAGLFVDPAAWNNAATNLVPVDVVDPENPTQRRRQYFNKATGEVTDAGQSSYVQPVDSTTGMTPTQTANVTGRQTTQAETHRHNTVTESQGGQRVGQGEERIGIARSRLKAGGGSGGSPRITRAQGAINGFQKLFTQKTQALARGDHRTADMLDGQIRTAGSNIRSVFGDVVGDDANGWPTVIKSQGGQSGPTGGQGSSQRVATQADVAEYARRTGVDVGRAAEHFRASGYAIQ